MTPTPLAERSAAEGPQTAPEYPRRRSEVPTHPVPVARRWGRTAHRRLSRNDAISLRSAGRGQPPYPLPGRGSGLTDPQRFQFHRFDVQHTGFEPR